MTFVFYLRAQPAFICVPFYFHRRFWERTLSDKPLILVTNDDGILSPGLQAAAEAVRDLADLLLVAPLHQQSSMGRSLPRLKDGVFQLAMIEVAGEVLTGYGLPGSPAQSVMYGILELDYPQPDLVISGINYGENMGTGSTISGTVGAALQAADMGVPALAVSLETDRAFHYKYGEVDWHVAQYFVRYFARQMLQKRMPFDVDVLNVNVPNVATEQTPWRVTKQSRQSYYRSRPTGRKTPIEGGILDYEISIDWHSLERDSDIYGFVADRVVTVTPLSIDLTSRTSFPALQKLLAVESS